jgi:hypothetical protein
MLLSEHEILSDRQAHRRSMEEEVRQEEEEEEE